MEFLFSSSVVVEGGSGGVVFTRLFFVGPVRLITNAVGASVVVLVVVDVVVVIWLGQTGSSVQAFVSAGFNSGSQAELGKFIASRHTTFRVLYPFPHETEHWEWERHGK